MKTKIFAAIVLSALLCLAQTNNQSTPGKTQSPEAQAQSDTKAACPCCKGMSDSKDAKPCCHHDSAAKDGKEAMSCCQGKEGKDAMSCMKGDKDKLADACCAKGKCCDDGKEGCCSKSDKTTEQVAMACCGANGEHCGAAHHDHADINK